MKNNVIIDVKERIDQDLEDFRIAAVDTEKNYTASRIRLCRDPENERPILFYSQELSRNFKNPDDPFVKRRIIKTFTPDNLSAVADVTLQHKFQDTLLAHKDRIPDYSPLTDIHSADMNLFMDEETAVFLEDVGINTDGLAEDFSVLESVEATPLMEDMSVNATHLKQKLTELQGKLKVIKHQMADEFSRWVDPLTLSEDAFEEHLARESVAPGLVQAYLALKEQIQELRSRLGAINRTVFTETRGRIKLPPQIERSLDELLQI